MTIASGITVLSTSRPSYPYDLPFSLTPRSLHYSSTLFILLLRLALWKPPSIYSQPPIFTLSLDIRPQFEKASEVSVSVITSRLIVCVSMADRAVHCDCHHPPSREPPTPLLTHITKSRGWQLFIFHNIIYDAPLWGSSCLSEKPHSQAANKFSRYQQCIVLSDNGHR